MCLELPQLKQQSLATVATAVRLEQMWADACLRLFMHLYNSFSVIAAVAMMSLLKVPSELHK